MLSIGQQGYDDHLANEPNEAWRQCSNLTPLAEGDIDIWSVDIASDPATVNDLPDENGAPLRMLGDSHDVLTGSNRQGRLNNAALSSTCNDWTSADGRVGANQVMCGHSWPRDPRSGRQWISDHAVRGCAPGVNLIQNGPGVGDCVGCGGGWGAVYCFALTP